MSDEKHYNILIYKKNKKKEEGIVFAWKSWKDFNSHGKVKKTTSKYDVSPKEYELDIKFN